MSLLAPFRGYFPGYSREIAEHRNRLTWSILKAHTAQPRRLVTLQSADPTEPPLIDFHYFDPRTIRTRRDLGAVVDGIRFARKLAAPLLRSGAIAAEEVPGPHVQTDAELAQFVRDHAWGHHACGTCAIGSVAGAAISACMARRGCGWWMPRYFRAFPGYFIASAVYMIGEKAADVILADAMG